MGFVLEGGEGRGKEGWFRARGPESQALSFLRCVEGDLVVSVRIRGR